MISERVATWIILFVIHGGAMFAFGYFVGGRVRYINVHPKQPVEESWWSRWWRSHPRGGTEEPTGNPD